MNLALTTGETVAFFWFYRRFPDGGHLFNRVPALFYQIPFTAAGA